MKTSQRQVALQAIRCCERPELVGARVAREGRRATANTWGLSWKSRIKVARASQAKVAIAREERCRSPPSRELLASRYCIRLNNPQLSSGKWSDGVERMEVGWRSWSWSWRCCCFFAEVKVVGAFGVIGRSPSQHERISHPQHEYARRDMQSTGNGRTSRPFFFIYIYFLFFLYTHLARSLDCSSGQTSLVECCTKGGDSEADILSRST
ncbi:uncharacterized protein K452DRAFT_168545 [Aplosporella prunicola CBS 121167]|uniref:Uncharacterized protein n=1 Tax=Aplosporella prunicola CBS 121167 TaxID=1176127 RepID=A0A6A6BKA9_9PEZI|nr:uncharacterized protein K452DRAFT_168545 [Aplosporella prunicola CBS 121167]KAF2143277.1 hypothetical protein K452DRAFT_168545 [Aplosporella prunicola CBS 121167]